MTPIEVSDIAQQLDEWADHVHDDTLSVYQLQQELREMAKSLYGLLKVNIDCGD
jgi:hypothetical protein